MSVGSVHNRSSISMQHIAKLMVTFNIRCLSLISLFENCVSLMGNDRDGEIIRFFFCTNSNTSFANIHTHVTLIIVMQLPSLDPKQSSRHVLWFMMIVHRSVITSNHFMLIDFFFSHGLLSHHLPIYEHMLVVLLLCHWIWWSIHWEIHFTRASNGAGQ